MYTPGTENHTDIHEIYLLWPFQSQEFQFVNWIIPFTSCQTLRGICYDPLFPLLDLIQNCTKSIYTTICVETERALKSV